MIEVFNIFKKREIDTTDHFLLSTITGRFLNSAWSASTRSICSFQSLGPISLSLQGLLRPPSLFCRPEDFSSSLLIILNETFPFCASTFFTRIFTFSPTETIDATLSTRLGVNADIWTNPSISPEKLSPNCDESNLTKAPKSNIDTTSPSTNVSSNTHQLQALTLMHAVLHDLR